MLYNFHVTIRYYLFFIKGTLYDTIQRIKNCQSLQHAYMANPIWNYRFQPLMNFLHCNWFDIILILKISLNFSRCITIIVVIETESREIRTAANKRFLINLSQSNRIRRRLKMPQFFQIPIITRACDISRFFFQLFYVTVS